MCAGDARVRAPVHVPHKAECLQDDPLAEPLCGLVYSGIAGRRRFCCGGHGGCTVPLPASLYRLFVQNPRTVTGQPRDKPLVNKVLMRSQLVLSITGIEYQIPRTHAKHHPF